MAVKSGKNTKALARFRAALANYLKKTGKKNNQVASEIGVSSGNFSNIANGDTAPSLAHMELIADKLGLDLADMLAEGRDILANNDKPMEEADVLSISTTYLDHDLIIRVVVILEDFLKQQKKWLDSENKAKAFIQMYEARKEHEANGGTVEDSYTLLLPILSEALTHAVDEPLQKTG